MVSSSTINSQQVTIDIDDLPPDHAVSASPSTSRTKDENNNTPQPPVKESLLTIFQLLYNCKVATSDDFLKERCRDINILDGSFYINTLQSLKYNDSLISLAESIVDYTDNLKAPPLNVAQLLHLMSIPQVLLKESREKRELVVGIIRNYEDNLRSLKKVCESIKKHKKDLTRGKETMPIREIEYKECKERSESFLEKSKKCLYFGAGVSLCNAFYIIIIISDGNMEVLFTYFSIFTITTLSFAILIAGIRFHFDSIEYSKISKDIKTNIEKTKRLMANTNETEIKVVELNAINLTRRIPSVLGYWKNYKESLEELNVIINAGGHNFDPNQMGDKWKEIKDDCENYGQIVREVLEQNDLLNGRNSKN